ncbi:DNA primase [Lachnospiraceae bacterium C1.1]|nr:DNA primase [Lachnospiraceae bacterium C1.1]
MYYPDEIIEEIRSKNDIVDVIGSYVQLKKKGGYFFGICPFHSEKSPSFSVTPGKQIYHCFGCGVSGNVITFIMNYENCSFPEAVKILADKAGVKLPEAEYSEEAKRKNHERQRLFEIQKEAAGFYYKTLRSHEGEVGMKYFIERKLSRETMQSFGLGFSGKSGHVIAYLKSKGYTEKELMKSGLVNFDEKRGMSDKFWNRVMFPIMDVQNRVIGFGGRVMGDGKPKYLNSPETAIFEKGKNLYGLNAARRTRKGYMIACEGYMDVISLHQAGFTEAVASLGTAFTPEHARILKRYTNDIRLTYDSDEAGIKAALRAIPILKSAGISSRIIHMEPYKDPDEFIKNLGAEEFQKRIDSAENSFFFEISVKEKAFDMNDPDGRTRFEEAVAQRLAEIDSELERENYTDAVANKYMIKADALKRAVALALLNRPSSTAVGENIRINRTLRTDEKKEDGAIKAEKHLLNLIAEEEGVYDAIKEIINVNDFSEGITKKAAEMLFEQAEAGNIVPAAIISRFDEAGEQNAIADIFSNVVPENLSKQEKSRALTELVIRIKKASLARIAAHAENSVDRIIREKQAMEKLARIQINL